MVVVTQPLIAHLISAAFSMLATIDFYDQASLTTNEVNDVLTNRLLADEFMAIDRARS